MSAWYKLDRPERGSIIWESASIRSDCTQTHREISGLVIDGKVPPRCEWCLPGTNVTELHKKGSWANYGELPVTSTPACSLHQLLPPGSCQVLVPALTSFSDGLLFGMLAKILLSSKIVLVMVFHIGNRNSKRTIKT